ncbi:sulfite exporter TauE/SafE family protein [Spongorhabdus nitratireducens]
MPLPEVAQAVTAFSLGLLGSAHCIGMCGGITTALGAGMPSGQHRSAAVLPMLLAYNTGRIFSYAVAGSLVGSFGWLAASNPAGAIALRWLAGLMLVFMGLYIGGWWRILTRLEQAGGILWKQVQPMASRLLPAKNPLQALLLGGLWGWLPCGLVYSTLIWSASSGDGLQSGILMAFFGLGTLPSLLLTGMLASQLTSIMQKRQVRTTAALIVIGCGLWTIPGPHQAFFM